MHTQGLISVWEKSLLWKGRERGTTMATCLSLCSFMIISLDIAPMGCFGQALCRIEGL